MQAIPRSPAALRAAQLIRKARSAWHGIGILPIVGYAIITTFWALLALSLSP